MVSTSWLSASCVVLMCATAATANAQGISCSTGPTTDQMQQLTSRRQLRNLHWSVRPPPIPRPPVKLPRTNPIHTGPVDPPIGGIGTRPMDTPVQGLQTDNDLAMKNWRKKQEMLASSRTCQQCQQNCAAANGQMVGANPLTGLPPICLSRMSAIKNCMELCDVSLPSISG